MVPLLPLRDGVRALPISFFRQSMPSFYMNAPDCICSPGRLPLGAFCTGRDGRYGQDWPTRCAFQSTHPVRGATTNSATVSFICGFQSTHPVRGATRSCISAPLRSLISIHAPRAGCDITPGDYLRRPKEFQSTHPVRGATLLQVRGRYVQPISIHAPRAGCDCLRAPSRAMHPISIHAPRAGCDSKVDTGGESKNISIHAPRAGCDEKLRLCSR